MKNLLLTSGLVCLISLCAIGQINRNDLQGNWIKCKAEMNDGSQIIDFQDTHNAFLEYKFDNKLVCINQDNMHYNICKKFKVKGDELIIEEIGTYTIERFGNDTLVILQKSHRKNEVDLKRFFLVKGSVMWATQDKVAADKTQVASRFVSPEFNHSLYEYLYDKLKTPIPPSRFKGYLVINRNSKSVQTNITEVEGIDADRLKQLVKALDKSFKQWNFKDYDQTREYKIAFVGKALDNDSYKNLRFAFYTDDYASIKKDERTRMKAHNQSIRHFNTAMELYGQRNFEDAIAELTKAYELDKVNIDAVYHRANLYNRTGQKDKACDDWKHLADLGQKKAQEIFNDRCGAVNQ